MNALIGIKIVCDLYNKKYSLKDIAIIFFIGCYLLIISYQSKTFGYMTYFMYIIASMAIGPDDLINDFNYFGFLFEDLCIRDIRIYSELIDVKVYHYRDKSGFECDAIIHRRNGDYALIEIRLYSDEDIEEGAENLKRLRKRINTDIMKEPKFMAVLTGSSFSYRRDDGIYVISIFQFGP